MNNKTNLPSKSCLNCKYYRTGSDYCHICSYMHGNGGLKWEHFDDFVNTMYEIQDITRGVDYQIMLNQIFNLGVRTGQSNAFEELYLASSPYYKHDSELYKAYLHGFHDGSKKAIGTFDWHFVLKELPKIESKEAYEIGDWEPDGKISNPLIVTDGKDHWIAVYQVLDGEAEREGTWHESFHGYKLNNVKMWAEFQLTLPVTRPADEPEKTTESEQSHD